MISNKLKTLFFVSIPFFIAHGFEEYFTGFFNVDPSIKFVFGHIATMPPYQAVFLLYQIMLWLLLVVSALFILGGKWPLRLMTIFGLIYIFELSHIWGALVLGNYYPGLITFLAFPILGFLYWKELIKSFRGTR